MHRILRASRHFIKYSIILTGTPKFTMEWEEDHELYTKIETFNNISWSNKLDIIQNHSDLLFRNFHKLNNENLAYAIANSKPFAEKFARHLVATRNINLYCNILRCHDQVASAIFENKDTELQNQLAEFLSSHYNTIVKIPHAVDCSIYYSSHFCNLMAETILKHPEILRNMSAQPIGSMLRKLNKDNKLKIYTMILQNMYKYDLTPAFEADSLDIFDDGQTFADKVTKMIINNKDFKLLQKIDEYELHYIIIDTKLWTPFVINNLNQVYECNSEVIDNLSSTVHFSYKLVKKLHKEDFVLTDCLCDTLPNIYKNVCYYYKLKLHDLYFKHRASLHNIDIHVIIQSWDVDFVRKLVRALIDEGHVNIINKTCTMDELKLRDEELAKKVQQKIDNMNIL